MTRIAVIGAGVVGLTSAVALQRKLPGLHVTLISERQSPQTTGDGSAGYWEPYLLEDTPMEDILRWAGKTYNFLLDLWKSPSAGKIGVSLIPSICVKEHDIPLPEWKDIVMGCSKLNKKEIDEMNILFGKNYKSGFRFISFTCEPSKLLPITLEEFKQRGGILEQKRISSLSEMSDDYDVIINCTGLEARFVAPDLLVHPIRGQVMRAKAPWVFHIFMDGSEDGCYIIPNQESVVLGGTHQLDWKLETDKIDAENIYAKCCSVMPHLRNASIEKHWVGLRPGRKCVRVERETRKNNKGETIEVVHNYGHGGAGVTLSWGCAEDVVNIVSNILQEKQRRSKL